MQMAVQLPLPDLRTPHNRAEGDPLHIFRIIDDRQHIVSQVGLRFNQRDRGTEEGSSSSCEGRLSDILQVMEPIGNRNCGLNRANNKELKSKNPRQLVGHPGYSLRLPGSL